MHQTKNESETSEKLIYQIILSQGLILKVGGLAFSRPMGCDWHESPIPEIIRRKILKMKRMNTKRQKFIPTEVRTQDFRITQATEPYWIALAVQYKNDTLTTASQGYFTYFVIPQDVVWT